MSRDVADVYRIIQSSGLVKYQNTRYTLVTANPRPIKSTLSDNRKWLLTQKDSTVFACGKNRPFVTPYVCHASLFQANMFINASLSYFTFKQIMVFLACYVLIIVQLC